MLSVYAKFFSRSHDAVIRVYPEGGNVITTTRMLRIALPPLYRPCLFNRACLPDERHITGHSKTIAVVDLDRICAGNLDRHQVSEVDVHDGGSYCAILS